MKKSIQLITLFVFGLFFSQKDASTIADKFESVQAQDFSVPPPPLIAFPAQFPKGNKEFLNLITKEIDKTKLMGMGKKLATKIIIHIDDEGNVISINTYGSNDTFQNIVMDAAYKVTKDIKWKSGQNKNGENVIDVLRLPFSFNN